MDQALVFAPASSSRISYVFRFLGARALGMSVSVTDQWPDFTSASGCLKIHYGKTAVPEADVNLPATGLLAEKNVRPITPTVRARSSALELFPVDSLGFDLSFDLPSAVFFLLSRYEEYLPFTPDQHGRFPAQQSFAYRHGFLDRPLINEWILQFRDTLEQKGIDLPPCPVAYSFIPTYDIDLAWAFRERPAWYQIAALVKDSFTWSWDNWRNRILVLSQQKKDPYDTYDWLHTLHQQYGVQPIYFWLLGDLGPYDRNISVTRPAFRKLILKVYQHYACGVHPSYQAAERPAQLRREVERFHDITAQHPVRSRQHYLRLSFPSTYQALLDVEVKADFTMGYASEPGFRASCAGPFYWYDLSQERETPLELHPFCVMDGTFSRYKKWSNQKTITYLTDLIERCRKAKAPLVSIWHNSSFYAAGGWDGMEGVYQTFLAKARP